MTAVLLALVAALSYGMSDFAGGLLSKTRSVWMVAVVGQLSAALTTAIVALLTPGDPQAADFAWAAAGGIAAAFGVAFLYRGLSRGRMGVVAPVSGVGAALVPVAVGLATGDQPSPLAWVGIAVAFPAIYLVTAPSRSRRSCCASGSAGRRPSGSRWRRPPSSSWPSPRSKIGLPASSAQLRCARFVVNGASIASSPSARSIRSSWLYFASRSDCVTEPILI